MLWAGPASIMAEFLVGVRGFSLVFRPALGPTQPLFSGYQGSFSGANWQGCCADHTSLHTCSTNYMNACGCNSVPPYAETTLLTLTHRDGLRFGETYIHTYIHTHTHTHTHTYIYTYIHTYIHTVDP